MRLMMRGWQERIIAAVEEGCLLAGREFNLASPVEVAKVLYHELRLRPPDVRACAHGERVERGVTAVLT